MKKQSLSRLVALYINYIFQLPTVIVMVISLLAMSSFMVMIANPWLSNASYLLDYESIHEGYLTMSLFMIQIFNSVIIATIIITIGVSSNSFDVLFMSHLERKYICIAKLVAIAIVMVLVLLIEFLLFYGIALFCFPLMKLKYTDMYLLLYLFISVFFELSLSILISTLIQTVFSPMSILFMSIGVKIAMQANDTFKKNISSYIPFISISNRGMEFSSIILSSIISFMAIILYIVIYNIKDIKI